jgi:hypothetical protein
MKRNFDHTLKTLDGSDVVDVAAIKDGVAPVLSMKTVAVNSLMATFEDDRNVSGDEKLNRYLLATRINAGGEVELNAEEILSLKKLIGRGYNALVVGQAFLFLEADAD